MSAPSSAKSPAAGPEVFRVPSTATSLVTRVSLKRPHGQLSKDEATLIENEAKMEELKIEEEKKKKKEKEKEKKEENEKNKAASRRAGGRKKAPVQQQKQDIPPMPEYDDSISPSSRALLKLFFYGMVRGVDRDTLHTLLSESWSSNPELTLQILMQARDARDGKGEKSIVHEALMWLRQNKPMTYLGNLVEFLRLGYFKDLLQLASLVKQRRLPLLGESGQSPIELELLAEFLRADRESLEKFKEKQKAKEEARAAAGGAAASEESKMEDVANTASASSSASSTSAASSASASDDFEILAAPANKSKKEDEVEVIPRQSFTFDLCFVLDCTGSMGAWMEEAKKTIRTLVTQLGLECARSGVAETKVRLALLAYHDYFDRNRFIAQPFTEDVDKFLAVLNPLQPDGGADLPEDVICGLEKALEFDWNMQADARMMILIADAPAHGKMFSDGDSSESTKHLAKNPEDPEATVKKIRDRGIHFTLTRITSHTDVMTEYFQGWYDNRAERRVMNVMELGQRVKRFLPALMEDVALAALGRKPVLDLPSDATKEDAAEEVTASASTQQNESDQPPAKRVKRAPTAQLSLAGKWAPTEGSAFDKSPYRFAGQLAALLYPSSKTPSKDYRQLCSSLRSELQVVERLMCTQQWTSIEFERVPARCHKLLKAAFQKHQPERYAKFLTRVKKGEVKIKTAGLQPNELIKEYRCMRMPLKENATTEEQWKEIVRKLKAEIAKDQAKEQATLEGVAQAASSSSSSSLVSLKSLNSLAMIDTSGSMTWNTPSSELNTMNNTMDSVTPIDAAIALGLIIAELTDGPFKDRVLSFSEKPSWLQLPASQSSSLLQRVDAIYSKLPSGGATNLTAALDMILEVATAARCDQKDLPQMLFVLSDMDLTSSMIPQESLEGLRSRYKAAGYRLPFICMWNLSGRVAKQASSSSSTSMIPGVTMSESTKGVAFLSGYSPSLLKVALKQDLQADPMLILAEAVAPYKNVVVDEQERD